MTELKPKTVSQCVTAEYCKGWNDAVEEAENTIKEFAEKIHKEIEKAVESNRKAKVQRLEKTKSYDSFVNHCDGKISALWGIDGYINELLEKMAGGKDD